MLAAAVAGCHSYPPPTPLDQLNAEQRAGHEVFEAKCARCHYDRRGGGLHGPSLESVFQQPSLPSGAPANDDRVTAAIMYGRGMMPAFGNQIDPQQLAELLAYLHTL